MNYKYERHSYDGLFGTFLILSYDGFSQPKCARTHADWLIRHFFLLIYFDVNKSDKNVNHFREIIYYFK